MKETIDIWICLFKDKRALDDYFAEPDVYEDGVPNNQFAKEQNQIFVDHDLVATEFKEGVENPKELLSEYIYSDSFRETVSRAYKESGTEPFNGIILVGEKDVEYPKNVDGGKYKLKYLGRFDYTRAYLDF